MRLCGFDVGLDRPFFLIAGPCVVESEQLQLDVAGQLKEMTAALSIPFIFKSSYDKANRSSGSSFRGWDDVDGAGVPSSSSRCLRQTKRVSGSSRGSSASKRGRRSAGHGCRHRLANRR